MIRQLSALLAAALLTLPVFGAEEEKPKSPEEMRALNTALIEKLSPSFVKVNYYLKTDDSGAGCKIGGFLCPGCGRWHRQSSEEYIGLKKPYSAPGFVIAPNMVLSGDILLPEENIDRIEIETADGKTAPAKIDAYYPGRSAMGLSFTGELPVKPLAFESPEKLPDELFSFFIVEEDGTTSAGTKPFSPSAMIRYLPSGEDFLKLPANSLIVDKQGNVLAVAFDAEIEMSTDWRLPPQKWQSVSAADRAAEHQNVLNAVKAGIFPVKFKLAEPPKSVSGNSRYRDDDDSSVERMSVGLLLEDGTLLVPLRLSSADCARIDRITVADGDKIIPADFVGAVKTYDLFIIRPQQKISGSPIKFAEATPDNYFRTYAWQVVLNVGENNMVVKATPKKSTPGEVTRGYDNMRFPDIDTDGIGFSADGKLISLPAGFRKMRQKRYSMLACGLLAKLGEFDAAYAPKPPEARFRIGWLGADYQRITPELAEATNLMQLTNGGETGLLVSDVAAGSPAEKAGIKPDDVLLRVTPESTGIPVELGGYEFDARGMSDFPWQEYDDLPEEYFDRIPFPWMDMNSGVNKLVSDFGIGSVYKLEYISEGKLKKAELTVDAAPECYYNAKRLNVKELGITVCNVTNEVRSYMRLKAEDPAVLIASVKAGTKASIAGIKPYEMIVKVGDTPVHNIAELKAATVGKSELRLEIKRLAVSRIVNVKLDAPLTYEEN